MHRSTHHRRSLCDRAVVPESPTTQGSPTEEQQQLEDHDIEDKADKEYPPPSDTEDEKMYRDAEEVSPSGLKLRSPPAGFGLCWNTLISQLPPAIGSRKSHIQGGWSSKPLKRSSLDPESYADTRGQLSGPLAATLLLTLPSRPSHHGSVATRVDCRTPSTTSCSHRKKDQFKAYGVKKDIPRMEMVHHQDVTVELSTHLLAAQREIKTLRIQLRNANTTVRGYMRMVEGQDSVLYA
jgi:hypothetical protein